MAKRYSGNLQINVVYDDRNIYNTSVSSGGKLLWRGTVKPAPAGFGPGVGYDSPQAYDEVARSALSFADHEVGGIGDEAEFDEDFTGYLVRRSKRPSSSHATKRSRSTIHVDDCVVMREPQREFITNSTGAAVFKVIEISGNALTIEGPMDHHPKHRRRRVMVAHQFKRVSCPHEEPTVHATRKTPSQLDREIAAALRPRCKVEVDTAIYRRYHGAEPRGSGNWTFVIGKREYEHINDPALYRPAESRGVYRAGYPEISFAKAKEHAIAEAKRRGATIIGVGP